MNNKPSSKRTALLLSIAITAVCARVFVAAHSQAQQPVPNLTGNWVVRTPRNDGTFSTTYLNLKQEDSKISGTIRVAQFYYQIKESTGDSDGFTLNASMLDGKSERKVRYEGKLVGDELHLAMRRRPDLPLIEMIATRARSGEGALPARIELPSRHPVPDNGLARTPPMGWNSWNKFASRVDDATVRSIADAMSTNGMKEAGYRYINIDDTWEAGRDREGNILTNKKFPDMKALADYVHSKGLKLGIYSSPGPNTCAGYEGSFGHEDQDARTYAKWGIDYLKYDWCGARTLYSDEEMPAVYQRMGDALLKTGRPIVYSLCQYGRLDVWKWGADVGGNLWRTTGDIRDTWDSMSGIGFRQSVLAEFANPGHWNDPDMLEIGNGGMTETEYKTHMTLWSMLAAPLLAGNDLRHMDKATLSILTNREVIAVDQDKLGRQGRQVWKSGDQEIWTRQLSDGGTAVALFNRSKDSANMTINWSGVGITKRNSVRDLWSNQKVDATAAEFVTPVAGHGVVLLRVQ